MNVAERRLRGFNARDRPLPAIGEYRQWQLFWRRLRRDKAAMVSAATIAVITALAIAAPAFAALTGHGPTQQFPNTGLSATGAPVGPGKTFWLGADELGRDLFIRILYGARLSLFIGVGTTAVGTVLGVAAGLAAGYFGGWIDMALSRFIDAVLAFPYIVLALALAAEFGPSLPMVIGVISFFAWCGIARVVRGQTIQLKEMAFVEAARSLGAGPWRIMFSEIMPNLLGPVLVLATFAIPSAILFEATLSFLGLGVQPPTPSWGNILAEAQNYYSVAWWYVLFPVLALLMTTLAFNILGDGIRDALDPRTERLLGSKRERSRRRPRWPRRSARQGTPLAAPGTRPEPWPGSRRPRTPAAGTPAGDADRRAVPAPAAVPVIVRFARITRGSPAAVLQHLIRRVMAGAVVLWAVSLGAFLLFFTRPAISVARSMAGKEPTAAELQEITRQLGLDEPIVTQYWHFLGRLLHGNLGYSYATGEAVTTILSEDLPRTASVVVGGMVLWIVAGIGIGILSATRPRSIFDRAATVGVFAGLSMPTFVLGQLLLLGVFLQLNKHGFTWIQNGYVGPTQSVSAWIGHMILPWVTLATGYAAVYSRLSRGSLLETFGEGYIVVARAKGLTERRVVFRHALRCALLPVVSQLGIDVGTLLGGVVVTESVFSIGGIGQDSVQAIDQGNLPVIIGFVLVAALFVVVASIVVDFCYTLLDPRIRLT
jgi:peptide/nickel transport system permease protein